MADSFSAEEGSVLIEATLNSIDARVESIDAQVSLMTEALGGLNEKLSSGVEKLVSVEEKAESIERMIDQFAVPVEDAADRLRLLIDRWNYHQGWRGHLQSLVDSFATIRPQVRMGLASALLAVIAVELLILIVR